ncbi:putative serine protease K12H4.7 [Ixodes scapularis]|uniref:putative serine protease K12H4.7 n=1 Tax=Ixodes scapularis TaxID=6945 RepID=UPI001A9F0B4C|nr:putative serine protease K12H4.7 [Ixodes scapularis]
MLLVVAVVALSLASQTVDGTSLMHRGRPRGRYGMLGLPKSQLLFASKEPQELWFTQNLCHFDPANTDTWKQRYFVSDEFYRPGGPVFLLLGGEGAASARWLSAPTHIMLLAKQYGALVFQLEHRFYGRSLPTKDMSVDNLAHLTSEQALADAATFRDAMVRKHSLKKDSKWVVFGGSYSGSLAAWFKLKYPHLAVGAVASSAPLFAIIDFKDYLRVVRDSLATTGPECNKQIELAVDRLTYLSSQPENWPQLKDLFKLCTYFNGYNRNDVANFFQSLAGNFEGIVQYNKDAREFEGGNGSITIDTLCDKMTDPHDQLSPLEKFAAVNSLLLNATGQKCLDYDYDTFINSMREIEFNSTQGAGGRQWTYQTCVEFGYFQSSDLRNQPFGSLFPVEFFVQQCRDIFGAHFDEALLQRAVERTNTFYGGLHPGVRNVTFPNGSIDPWHALGITKDLAEDVTSIYIKGTAHCADMYPPSDKDLPELTEARERIAQLVGEWISAA